jgi:chromatin segregation and condensation protein Rec8/ScpA/Scc1 (kleisin family)
MSNSVSVSTWRKAVGAVVTFLAMLELLREHLIDLVQQEALR